jgi:hypothetical protein
VVAVDQLGRQSLPSNTVTVTTPTPAVNPLGAPFGPPGLPVGPATRGYPLYR